MPATSEETVDIWKINNDSEETDSIVLVISEETAKISLAENGRFIKIGMDEMDLRRHLNERMFISSGD